MYLGFQSLLLLVIILPLGLDRAASCNALSTIVFLIVTILRSPLMRFSDSPWKSSTLALLADDLTSKTRYTLGTARNRGDIAKVAKKTSVKLARTRDGWRSIVS